MNLATCFTLALFAGLPLASGQSVLPDDPSDAIAIRVCLEKCVG